MNGTAQAAATVEAELTQIWADVLGRPAEAIRSDANFFALGGDSLLILQVMDRVNARFFSAQPEAGLPVADFFACGTIGSLADHLLSRDDRGASPAAAAPQSDAYAVAVIGMAGRFPGAPDVRAFWRNLRDGIESIQRVEEAELRVAGVSETDLKHPRYVRACALIEGVRRFDARYFGMTPREVAITSPEQRLLIECAEEALQDAGHGMRRAQDRVGVFVGSGLSSYLLLQLASGRPKFELSDGMALLASNTSAATRISYLLNLSGPSLTLDTACSSSLVAVHQACRSLLAGECRMALAGGATVRLFAPRGYLAEEGGIFSPDGHCRPFDEDAAGTVSSSGAGVIVLKRLADAVSDGDTIRAVIRGTAVNNDGGEKAGYTAPSASAQAEVIRQALKVAALEPHSIHYVETHGTATKLGDFIEISALKDVFRGGSGPLLLGTLKANIGHTEAAAGIAALTKTVLALEHGEIPPAIHFTRPNSSLGLDRTAFQLNARLADWPVERGRRCAGVSSFGIGGTNAHAIVTEGPGAAPTVSHRSSQLLILSAHTESALQTMRRQLAEWLQEQPDIALAAVAQTLQLGRKPLSIRDFVVASTVAEAVAALRAKLGANASTSPTSSAPRIAFRFPGDSSHSVQALRTLHESEPVFREHLARCAALLPGAPEDDVRAMLFAVEYALAALWQSWGVQPTHSVGEGIGAYVAACIRGQCSLEEALHLMQTRGRVDFEPADRSFEGDRPPANKAMEIVLEVGPGATSEADTAAAALLSEVGRLWQRGVKVDWAAFNHFETVRRIPLPTYPFERQEHWLDATSASSAVEPAASSTRSAANEWFYTPIWKQRPRLADGARANPAREGEARQPCCVLLDCEPALAHALGARLTRNGIHAVFARSATDARHDSECRSLDLRDAAALAALVADLAGRGFAIRSIVHSGAVRGDSPLSAVLDVCRALADGSVGPLTLTLLTRVAHRVTGQEPSDPAAALLACVARVVSRELPGVTCRAIDLPDAPSSADAWWIGALAEDVVASGSDDIVAYRGARRWVRAYEKITVPLLQDRSLLRPHGVYLITGGLGGIGWTLARHLAGTCRARLVMVSRSSFPERSTWRARLEVATAEDPTSERIREVLAMESAGAEFLFIQGDVSSPDAMDRVAQATQQQFGALHGVIHAAGIVGGSALFRTTPETTARVTSPKVLGTQILREACRRFPLDFFVCCSSLASVLGPAGQVDYCAANAFQDAFCHANDDPAGTRFISINWTAWRSVGMSVDAAVPGHLREERNRVLADGLTCAEGTAIFDTVMKNPLPQWAISTQPIDVGLASRRDTGLAPSEGEIQGVEEALPDAVASIWRELLGVASSQPEDDFFELGGDSLLVVELKTRLESRFSRTLSLRTLMARPTLAAMTKVLQETA